jgi:hypothetical protein
VPGYNDYGRAEPIPCHAIAFMPRPDVVPAALQSASREGEREGASASASARRVRAQAGITIHHHPPPSTHHDHGGDAAFPHRRVGVVVSGHNMVAPGPHRLRMSAHAARTKLSGPVIRDSTTWHTRSDCSIRVCDSTLQRHGNCANRPHAY